MNTVPIAAPFLVEIPTIRKDVAIDTTVYIRGHKIGDRNIIVKVYNSRLYFLF